MGGGPPEIQRNNHEMGRSRAEHVTQITKKTRPFAATPPQSSQSGTRNEIEVPRRHEDPTQGEPTRRREGDQRPARHHTKRSSLAGESLETLAKEQRRSVYRSLDTATEHRRRGTTPPSTPPAKRSTALIPHQEEPNRRLLFAVLLCVPSHLQRPSPRRAPPATTAPRPPAQLLCNSHSCAQCGGSLFAA